MTSFLELLTCFNWLLLPQVIAESLHNADWDRASGDGPIGMLKEGVASVLGTNTWPFFVPISSGRNGRDIQRLLTDHGIRNWGWVAGHGQYTFRVRDSQAAWAQYVLQREQIPLDGRLYAGEPSGTPQRPDKAKDEGTGQSVADRLDSVVTSFWR